jgi:Tetrahydrofolate dehydrogenase/cyclohydrolase, NAD(P)-binding domain
MSVILKGAPVVAAMNEANAARCAALREKGVVPTLAVVRVGAREDDLSYEKGVMARCAKVGVEVKQFLLPADAAQEELLGVIACINADPSIHGCLLFRPLPRQFDDRTVRAALAPEKDIDGITDGSLAGVFTNTALGYPPCTAQACLEILKFYGIPLSGRRAVVVGRSLVVGKPAAMMLDRENATVTLCNSRTRDLPEVCREADIVVVAMGKAGAVGAEHLREGQVVVDVGIHVNEEGKLCGDVRFGEAEPLVEAITPVPGGVGTVTTSVLVSHVVEAARKDGITSLLGKKQRGPSAKDDPLCFLFYRSVSTKVSSAEAAHLPST